MTIAKVFGIIRELIFFSVAGIFLLCMLYACASVGSPQGGPEDRTPPRFVSSTPMPDALNYQKNKVEILFDELIVVEKPSEKIIITPPQMEFPVIKALGKKVTVEIKDSLRLNTTYTIDFTDAIVDNNEKNSLENFSFAFSTGETVDSLVVAGTLLSAENLEPMQGILIGLHENLEDSAFVTIPFSRTSKTNDRGQFWIRNVSPGSYKIYALNDLNRDYKFDQAGEDIAFSDSIIIPDAVPASRMDTLWRDSLTIDTIIQVDYTHFTPDDVILFLFKEKFERSYLRKSERSAPHKFSLFFNAPLDTLPKIKVLNIANPIEEDWSVIVFTEENKTLNYWIKDSLIYKQDTLQIEVSYYKSDSLNHLTQVSDTLRLFEKNRAKPKKEKKEKNNKEEEIEFLEISVDVSPVLDVFDSINIIFSEPLLTFDSSYIALWRKIDSTQWEPQSFSIRQEVQNPMMYTLSRKWEYGHEFKISIDSAVFIGIYEKWNAPLEKPFKIKPENEYGHLYVYVEGISENGYGELLDGSEKVIRKASLKDGGLLFMNLKPSKYFLRYIIDTNGNTQWDTGNYRLHQHPEKVYYYPDFLDIRQNWRIEQHWDVISTPITKQKPLEITKNKPKEKKKDATIPANQSQHHPQNSRLIAPGM
jgi:uncharacterized protein (DUF2141 family)